MKFRFLLLTFFIVNCAAAQTIKLGKNLKTEFKKIKKGYFFSFPQLSNWAESKGMYFIGAKPNANDCDYLFVALKDTTLIGVYKRKEPSAFLFDTKGNSILSDSSEFFLLPFWVVKNRTKVVPTDKSILSLLDAFYEETLQADETHPLEETIKKYQRYQTDTSLANRHIALLFDNYQALISETSAKGKEPPASIAIPLVQRLGAECMALYNRIPVIVCIYIGEALQTADMTEDARKHFKTSLELYPNSIPLQVYNYRYEQDPVKKNEQLLELKKKHAGHWMVKGL
jgi:hypothetical protein